MTANIRILVTAAVMAAIAVPASTAVAQNPRSGAPRVAFGPPDLAKVKWLEGSWVGTAEGENAIYQRFKFVDDSTVQITYYRDPGFGQQAGSGRLYLSVGRIYHTFGSNRWVATRIGDEGLYLVPQSNTRSNFAWTYVSPDAWTFTMRTGAGGRQHVTIYNMKRVGS
jgi:hypothetical protein